VSRAFVAGDPCYDRIVASLPRRLQYRRAFHLRPGQQLITVASTWREDLLFGLDPLLVSRMLSELPYDRYRVALVLHPNVWASHSSFQVKAWLAEALRAGLILIPPEEGWRAAIIAADWFVSDHGSISVYAAAAGRPVLLEKSAIGTIDTRSALGRLLDIAATLDVSAPLEPQLRFAEELQTRTQSVATDWITSAPGYSLQLIREKLFQLMNVPPPGSDPIVLAIDSPLVDDARPTSLWTHVECADAETNRFSIRRHPAAIARSNQAGVLIVNDQELDHRLLALADVIWTTAEALPSDEERWSADVIAHRPGVRLTVVQTGRRATLRSRDSKTTSVIIDLIDGPREAELVFAVLAERLLSGAADLLSLNPLVLDLGSAEPLTAIFRAHVH
jgi:hypothetical protein